MISKKDKATRRKLPPERRWRHTGLLIDWEIYRDFRNMFNAKLNNFRNKQYSTMVEENKDDPATLFRVINKSLHRKQSSPLPPNKIDKIRENIDSQQSELENDIITPDGNHEALFDEFF